MNPYNEQRLLTMNGRGGGWVGRLLLGLAAASLVVVAAVFLTFALIAGALIAAVVGARFWWTLRKVRAKAKATEALEGEYRVVDRGETLEHIER